MVIRAANRDTKKRGEFVKGEMKRRTERREEEVEDERRFFVEPVKVGKKNKRALRKLYMQAKHCWRK